MPIYKFIPYFSILIGVIVAIAYYRTKFKYFFFLLALSDAGGLIFLLLFSITAQTIWVPLVYLLIFSIEKDFFLRWKHLILSGLILILFFNYFATNIMQHYFFLIANVIILIIFLKYLVTDFIKLDKLNLFYLVMVFNETIVVIKFIAFINEVELGVNVYYAGTLIESLIGVFLIFYSKRVFLDIK